MAEGSGAVTQVFALAYRRRPDPAPNELCLAPYLTRFAASFIMKHPHTHRCGLGATDECVCAFCSQYRNGTSDGAFGPATLQPDRDVVAIRTNHT